MNPGTDEAHPNLFLGSIVVSVEVLAVGAHIHEKDGGIQRLFAMFFGNYRLLDGVHAADTGTIIVVTLIDVSRTDALEPGNLLRLLLVGGPDKMALVWAGSAQDTLELNAGDHIGKCGVIVCIVPAGIENLEAGRGNNRAHLHSDRHLLHAVIHCLGLAGGHALKALTAGHTV